MQDIQSPTSMVRSQALFQEAQDYMPGGVNSPVRAFGAVGGVPRFIERAHGPYVYDVDGHRYIDYVGSWGPMILGHGHPAVVQAVRAQASKGISYGAPCELEVRLAESIRTYLPSIEKIRMVNSGTEASMTALRIARGATGRPNIIKFEGCYHGHNDSLLVKAGSGGLTLGMPTSQGISRSHLEETLVARFNDLESVSELFMTNRGKIAAVIVEPIAANMNMVKPSPGFLEGLKTLCETHGSVLILDEVITGFRVGLHGAQGLYGIQPDLTVLGKIIGGGLPVGAVGGRRALMDQLAPLGPVYQAGTLSGNPLAMAAGLATLEALKEPGFYETVGRRTQQLVDGMQSAADHYNIPLTVTGEGALWGFVFTRQRSISSLDDVQTADLGLFTRFFHHALNHGLYLAPSAFEAAFMSMAHTEAIIEESLTLFKRVFEVIAREKC